MNRKIKGEDDYKQEADENLLRGNLCKEEKHKVQTEVFYSLREMTDDIACAQKELTDKITSVQRGARVN